MPVPQPTSNLCKNTPSDQSNVEKTTLRKNLHFGRRRLKDMPRQILANIQAKHRFPNVSALDDRLLAIGRSEDREHNRRERFKRETRKGEINLQIHNFSFITPRIGYFLS